MSIIGSNILAGASGQTTGYNLKNSLRFRKSASASLSRTIGTPTNNKKWTYSCWLKRGQLGSSQYTALLDAYLDGSNWSTLYHADDKIFFYNILAGVDTNLDTVAVFRDPSAWYHIVFVFDSANATTADRGIIYVNGVRQTVNNTYGAITLNEATYINNSPSYVNKIGLRTDSSLYMDGYLAEINFIDGQALTPSSFGETDTTTGSWKPKAYTSTYGTNGFYLKFADTSAATAAAIGKDSSGNGNNWTPSGISVTAGVTYDAMLDVPTNTSATVANYAVLNPLKNGGTAPSGGNLNIVSTNDNTICLASIGMSSGKWYWEQVQTASTGSVAGIAQDNAGLLTYIGGNANSWGYHQSGLTYTNATSSIYGNTWTTNDIIGVAFDADNGKLYFSKNGTFQNSGNPVTGTNPAYSSLTTTPYFPAFQTNSSTTSSINFGQRPFAYTAPSGFVALNTYNLPTPTILQGNKYMDATLYTGTATGIGANTITITNAAGFKPDFVWAKGRSIAYANGLFNSVCGVNKFLVSNSTNAELVNEVDGYLTSFNSNGFTLGNGSNSNLTFNSSPQTYVAWQWQAGQGTTSSNTSGSITSTVSVNTTAGFSIVTYTGNNTLSTVGHGLGVGPKFIIVKTRSGTDGWIVYHASLGVQYYTFLNNTDASYNNLSNYWSSTAPSSTTFGINAYGGVNTNGATYVAYCWAEIAGFSKFGSYTGNGSADGPFVATNFKPKFILIKVSSTVNGWVIYDTMRDTYNYMGSQLYPNLSNAEAISSSYAIDALSNGFKIRTTNGVVNDSGQTFIYACFASNPFKNSNAV